MVLVGSRFTRNASSDIDEATLITEFTRDFILGISYVVALASATRMKAAIPLARVHEHLAEFSYTAYLCHFPCMLLLVAVGHQAFGMSFLVQPDWRGLAYLFGICALLYGYAYLFFLATEQHTGVVRRKLDGFFQD